MTPFFTQLTGRVSVLCPIDCWIHGGGLTKSSLYRTDITVKLISLFQYFSIAKWKFILCLKYFINKSWCHDCLRGNFFRGGGYFGPQKFFLLHFWTFHAMPNFFTFVRKKIQGCTVENYDLLHCVRKQNKKRKTVLN